MAGQSKLVRWAAEITARLTLERTPSRIAVPGHEDVEDTKEFLIWCAGVGTAGAVWLAEHDGKCELFTPDDVGACLHRLATPNDTRLGWRFRGMYLDIVTRVMRDELARRRGAQAKAAPKAAPKARRAK